LRDAVNQAVAQPVKEQVQLYAELQLTRVAAEQAVRNFSFVSSLPDSTDGKLALVMQAGAMMTSCMEQVACMAERVAKIEALAADKFSVTDLGAVVSQIAQVAERVFSKLPQDIRAPLLQEFSDAMQTQVQLTAHEQAVRGTNLLPDETVRAFDATVPDRP
jgi:hypothetical protein